MTEVEFCYFLQGFFELDNPKVIDSLQLTIIKEYLNKIDINKNMTNDIKTNLNNLAWLSDDPLIRC